MAYYVTFLINFFICSVSQCIVVVKHEGYLSGQFFRMPHIITIQKSNKASFSIFNTIITGYTSA
ncbi:hypothetical protein AVZ29_18280 [Cronobacter sakazakii]|nr:hypothetical protein AVZ29_18280 [Cronobacter sakazakii]